MNSMDGFETSHRVSGKVRSKVTGIFVNARNVFLLWKKSYYVISKLKKTNKNYLKGFCAGKHGDVTLICSKRNSKVSHFVHKQSWATIPSTWKNTKQYQKIKSTSNSANASKAQD